MPLNVAKIAQAVMLLNAGGTVREVSSILNVSRSTLWDAVQRYQETGSYERRPGSGRKRSTSERDDRFIVNTILRNRHTTAVEVRQSLREVRNVNVSERTIRRRLREKELQPYRPVRVPRLLASHRTRRIQFAENHLEWSNDQWKNVLFTDESRVGLYVSDGRHRVYRRPGERMAACTLQETEGFQGGSVMIWGGISYDARTELVFIERGGLTAARYVEEILQPHVTTFRLSIGEDFILMHDNARPHVARCVKDYLEEVGIAYMDWPARSPDMNPIEHLWDQLKRRVRGRLTTPRTLQELRNALLEEWRDIPQSNIQNLIRGMSHRLEAVIRVRGGNTEY